MTGTGSWKNVQLALYRYADTIMSTFHSFYCRPKTSLKQTKPSETKSRSEGAEAKTTPRTRHRNAAISQSGMKVEEGIISRQKHWGRNLESTLQMASGWPTMCAYDHT